MVPESFGGIGADSFTYATVLSKIAQGCASTGLTFNMHSAILFFLRQIATPAQQERYFGEVVTDGAVFSSITSEPGISFRHKGRVRTHIERDGDGYRLTGRKIFCSLSTGATYYFTWSFLEGAESLADGLLTVLIPTGREGITILDDWDTLGMRGHGLQLDRFRERPHRTGPKWSAISAAILGQNMSIWSVGYTAVYIGIAEAAFEYCVNAMRAPRSDGSPPTERGPLHVAGDRSSCPCNWRGARRARDTLGYLSGELEHGGPHLRAEPGQVPRHGGRALHHDVRECACSAAAASHRSHPDGALPPRRHGRPRHAAVQRALPGDGGQARPRSPGEDGRVRVDRAAAEGDEAPTAGRTTAAAARGNARQARDDPKQEVIMAKLTKLDHGSLCVGDIDKAVWFYGDLLGLEPLPRPDFGFPGAWFDAGGTPVHLTTGGFTRSDNRRVAAQRRASGIPGGRSRGDDHRTHRGGRGVVGTAQLAGPPTGRSSSAIRGAT